METKTLVQLHSETENINRDVTSRTGHVLVKQETFSAGKASYIVIRPKVSYGRHTRTVMIIKEPNESIGKDVQDTVGGYTAKPK